MIDMPHFAVCANVSMTDAEGVEDELCWYGCQLRLSVPVDGDDAKGSLLADFVVTWANAENVLPH